MKPPWKGASWSRRRPGGRDRRASLAEAHVARRQLAQIAERVEHLVLHRAPHAGRPEVVVVRLRNSRHRHVVRGQHRLKVPAEREPLERVVGHAVLVEVTPEPAPAAERVRLADLPVVAEVKCDWFASS